jgi:hypothetical protein
MMADGTTIRAGRHPVRLTPQQVPPEAARALYRRLAREGVTVAACAAALAAVIPACADALRAAETEAEEAREERDPP